MRRRCDENVVDNDEQGKRNGSKKRGKFTGNSENT